MFSYRQDLIKPLSIVIYKNCSDWTTTKAYAPYVDVRRVNSIKKKYAPLGAMALNIVYYE